MHLFVLESLWGLLIAPFLNPAILESFLRPVEAVEVTREVYLMGTRCRLTAYSKDRQNALQQLEAFLVSLEKTEQELSNWRHDSTLSLINETPIGSPLSISQPLFRLFTDLRYWCRATDSAFDPTIGSLIEAWRLGKHGQYPSRRVLDSALKRSGMTGIKLDPAGWKIVRARDVSIDSGAFGKGEGLDRLLKIDAPSSSISWLVDLGGQIMVYGHPPHASSWKVDLAHPIRRQEPVVSLELRSGSLATSGGSERDVEVAEGRVGHILDPRTGLPASFNGSVTVWHPSGLAADVLSTALYVMKPEDGLRWAEARNLAVCYLTIPEKVREGKVRIRPSKAFVKRFLKP